MDKQARRHRREFLYRMSIENKTKETSTKKRKLKEAFESGERIPTHLKGSAIDLMKSQKWDDEGAEAVTTHCDDEYQWAGEKDPQIVLTTSHNPSSNLKKFVKELKLVFPNAQRINRGNFKIDQLVTTCRNNNYSDLILVNENRGIPDTLTICHMPFGPTAVFNLKDVVMRHDLPNMGTMSQAYPNLVFDNFESKVGNRVKDILKNLFPIPKLDSCKIISFINNRDVITFSNFNTKKVKGEYQLEECGPRFNMTIYKIMLGTLDMEKASEIEYIIKPYKNTAKNHLALSDEPSAYSKYMEDQDIVKPTKKTAKSDEPSAFSKHVKDQ